MRFLHIIVYNDQQQQAIIWASSKQYFFYIIFFYEIYWINLCYLLKWLLFCQNIMFAILLVALIISSKSQYIQSGIVTLKSSQNNNISEYSLSMSSANEKILISLSTFQWAESQNFCIYTEQQTSIKISCSSGINTISYIKYYPNPLIFTSYFTYYFFDNSVQNASWTLPIQLTKLNYPTIGAFILGFQSTNSSNNAIELKPSEDGLAIHIIRTANVKYVNFTYIIFQYHTSFPFVFYLSDSGQSIKTMQGRKLINFYGLTAIRLFSSIKAEIPLIQPNTSGIISLLNQLQIKNNSIIQALLFERFNKPYNCSVLPYYDTSSNICVQKCPLNYKLYTQINSQNFCYFQQKSLYLKNQSIRLNNLDQLQGNSGSNCEERRLDKFNDVICLKCKKGYKLFRQKCYCDYQFYQQNNTCYQCKIAQQCQIYTSLRVQLIETQNVNINNLLFTFQIPQLYHYQYDNSAAFQQNIQINSQKYELSFLRNITTGLFQSRLQNISMDLPFQIQSSQYPTLQNQNFFLISKQNMRFFWKLNESIIINDKNFRPSNILKKTKKVVNYLNENFHYVILVAVLIKLASCLLDFYQSASIIYLFTLLSLPKQYEDIQNAVKNIFALIPSSPIIFFGENGLLKIQKYDFKIVNKQGIRISIDGKQEQLFISLVFNQIIIITLQFLGVVFIIKLLIYLLSPSKNAVCSINQKEISYKYCNQNLECQKMKSPSKLTAIQQYSLRYRLLKALIKKDRSKFINFLSNIKMFSIGLSILFFQQSSIQTYNVDILVSKVSGFLSFALFLFLPVLILQQSALNILKSANTIYKRRKYTKASLCTYFIVSYYHDIFLAFTINFIHKGIVQIIALMLIITAKLIFSFSVMKNIEKIKHTCYLLIFLGGICSHKIDSSGSNALKQSIISLILLVVACDAFKILKLLILGILQILNESQTIYQDKRQKNKSKLEFIPVQHFNDNKKLPIKYTQKFIQRMFVRKHHTRNQSQMILIPNNNTQISKMNQKKQSHQ